MVIAFLLLPFMIGHLGKESYGIYELVLSILGYLPLLTLTLGPAVARYVTDSVGRDDREGVNRYMSAGMVGAAVAAVALFLASGSIALALPIAVELAGLAGEVQVLLVLLGLTSGITYAAAILGAPLYSRERLAEMTAVTALADVIRMLGIVALFTLVSSSLVWVGVSALTGAITSLGVMGVWAFRVFPWLRLSRRLVNRRVLGQILGFSAISSVGVLAEALYYSTDNFLIKGIYGPAGAELITVYAVGARWDGWVRGAIQPLVYLMMPRMTLLSAQDRVEDMRRLARLSIRYAAALATPVCIFVSFFGRPILSLWLGDRLTPEEISTAARVIPIFLLPLLTSISLSPCQAVFIARARIGAPTVATLVGAIVNVGLSVVLATWAGWGLLGIAAGTGITIGTRNLFFIPYYMKRVLGVGILELARELARPALLALVFTAACTAAELLARPESVIALAATFVACGALHVLAGWAVVLESDDRARILTQLRSLATRR